MATDNEKKTLDYGTFLADLEAKRAALDQAIASLRAVVASGALAVNVGDSMPGMTGSVSVALHGGDVPAGAFLGKSIPEATKLYLSIVKQKQTTREIADGLRKGGMETTSHNFEGIVAAGIHRASKKEGEIVKVGRAWALAAWYPAGIRAAVQEKRQARKSKKSRRQERPPKSESKTETQLEGPKPKDRILQILRNQPGMELSLQELADHLRMERRAVNMALINLLRGKAVQKTAGGKYRLAA